MLKTGEKRERKRLNDRFSPLSITLPFTFFPSSFPHWNDIDVFVFLPSLSLGAELNAPS